MAEMKYIQVPPDSTGKRVGHSLMVHLHYVGGTNPFEIGDIVIGEQSGVTGEIASMTQASTISEGVVHILVDDMSPEDFVQGENLRVDNIVYAQADIYQNIYHPKVQVAGRNSGNVVAVDNKGAMFTRGTDGSNQFDAFGKMEVSQRTTIGEYVFTYDDLPDDLHKETVGTASIQHQPQSVSLLMSTGTTTGDSAKVRSHLYHKYQASIAQTFNLSLAIGDNGKENVVRRWGYFDDDDGLFFELEGTNMCVTVRSSVSGTVQETKYEQSNWNGDRMDGTGGSFNLSRNVLDLAKLNVYWIDFQWLGAGRVRFGVIVDGERITCHSTEFKIQSTSLPFMRTGTLPVSFEQENTGTVASTSEMRMVCCSVSCEGAFSPQYRSFSSPYELPPSEISTSSYAPLFSGRAKQMFKGKDNRIVILPRSISIYVHGTSPVAMSFIKNGTLTNDSWTLDIGPESGTEIDGTATDIAGGRTIWTRVVAPGKPLELNLEYLFNLEQGETVIRHADVLNYDSFTLMGRLLVTGDPVASVNVSINWIEIQ